VKKALCLSSLVLSLALIAGPASASEQFVELAPATEIISNDAIGLPDPFAPLADLYRPLLPPVSTDDRNASAGDQEGSKGCKVVGSEEQRFAEKINKARARRDRKPVHIDMHISAVAATHSRAMKREAQLRHTGERKLRERVTRWELLGENVGRGGTVDSLHQAFMESEGHRQTVVSKEFRYVGVGIARDEDQIWVTVLFESQIDPGTTMKLPEGC
jgi:uncharacterized protein YkwD